MNSESNVLGSVGTGELRRSAGEQRARVLGSAIAAIVDIVRAMACRMRVRARQRHEAHAVYETLRELDDRTLHDLGFDRSEIRSVAAEAAGTAPHTRIRVLQTMHGFPL